MEEKNVNNKTDILTILSELVTISSYGVVGKNHIIIEYLKNKFRGCCETLEIEDESGNIHLLVGVNHNLKDIEDSILLSGHIDTVRESEGHRCNVSIDGDRLKGLGISDMKSFIATIIANIDYLKNLDIPVIISLTSDEETDLLGIEHIIYELEARNINTSMAIVGEPTDLDYYVSSRGNSIYVSVMNGIVSHSGTPELGVNAIELQTQFVWEIMNIKNQYLKDATICITHIEGGKIPSNVVPDKCSTCFGIRTSNPKILDTIYDYLVIKHKEISKSYGESKLFNVLFIPPFERTESEFLNRQADINGKQLIDAKYATEAGYFQRAFPNANIVIYGPGDPENIHKAGESINPNNLLRYEFELKEMLSNYLTYRKQKKQGVKKLVYKQIDKNRG